MSRAARWRRRRRRCAHSMSGDRRPSSGSAPPARRWKQARLAAQETHVRRAALLEQFAETGCELAQVLASLTQEATVPAWEQSLAETARRHRAARTGQPRRHRRAQGAHAAQEYLDRQFADVSDALETLDRGHAAHRPRDPQRASRTPSTASTSVCEDKFPRLFGGGHAYLELVGEDPLAAGVAVMARPPGKRNSTIHRSRAARRH